MTATKFWRREVQQTVEEQNKTNFCQALINTYNHSEFNFETNKKMKQGGGAGNRGGKRGGSSAGRGNGRRTVMSFNSFANEQQKNKGLQKMSLKNKILKKQKKMVEEQKKKALDELGPETDLYRTETFENENNNEEKMEVEQEKTPRGKKNNQKNQKQQKGGKQNNSKQGKGNKGFQRTRSDPFADERKQFLEDKKKKQEEKRRIFAEIKQKKEHTAERQKFEKKCAYKTSKKQPVMQYKLEKLLEQIQKSNKSTQ